jgi:hypothetical protein
VETYVIMRRSAWADGPELEAAAAESTRVGKEEMPDDVKWIRSYVFQEEDGRLGTACVYQATSQAAAREHARRAKLRADEVLPVVDTVVVREDPQ